MTALPTPFVHADCDLRDFAFMPLDVVRLRDSDIAALSSGDEFRSAVLLWCASWHQVPAASLPDDDVVLSQLAGYGRVVREWKNVRDGALRGWVKCSDGRLYHPVVAEKAREAWEEKSRYAYSKLCERLRKAGVPRDKTPSYEVWLSSGKKMDFHWKESGIPERTPEPSAGIPPENALKGQGQGQGQASYGASFFMRTAAQPLTINASELRHLETRRFRADEVFDLSRLSAPAPGPLSADSAGQDQPHQPSVVGESERRGE